MPLSVRQFVQGIHDSGHRVALAIAGGGSRAIADLLEVPGASRTLIEACIPYAERALVRWLGARPDQCCSSATARAMAMAAFRRALDLEGVEAAPAGVACTAGLATDRPKLGPHRAHVAVQTIAQTRVWSLELAKQQRTRAEEERLVGRLVLNAVAAACGLDRRLGLDLLPGEKIEEAVVAAPTAWQDLLLGRTECVFQGAANPATGAVMPGAFNPLHLGHERMAEVAHTLLGLPVALEISIVNVDKPPLDYCEIQRRVGQFAPDQPVWLSRAATFEEKSRLFPCATFLVGTDTLRRIADPRYYAGDAAACRAALERIAGRGCKFLVFGRDMGTGLVRLSDLDLPEPLKRICREVPAETFREDVSSTAIRKSGAW
jgi:nicotinamide mononucleotide (NMN) deamidase PncC